MPTWLISRNRLTVPLLILLVQTQVLVVKGGVPRSAHDKSIWHHDENLYTKRSPFSEYSSQKHHSYCPLSKGPAYYTEDLVQDEQLASQEHGSENNPYQSVYSHVYPQQFEAEQEFYNDDHFGSMEQTSNYDPRFYHVCVHGNIIKNKDSLSNDQEGSRLNRQVRSTKKTTYDAEQYASYMRNYRESSSKNSGQHSRRYSDDSAQLNPSTSESKQMPYVVKYSTEESSPQSYNYENYEYPQEGASESKHVLHQPTQGTSAQSTYTLAYQGEEENPDQGYYYQNQDYPGESTAASKVQEVITSPTNGCQSSVHHPDCPAHPDYKKDAEASASVNQEYYAPYTQVDTDRFGHYSEQSYNVGELEEDESYEDEEELEEAEEEEMETAGSSVFVETQPVQVKNQYQMPSYTVVSSPTDQPGPYENLATKPISNPGEAVQYQSPQYPNQGKDYTVVNAAATKPTNPEPTNYNPHDQAFQYSNQGKDYTVVNAATRSQSGNDNAKRTYRVVMQQEEITDAKSDSGKGSGYETLYLSSGDQGGGERIRFARSPKEDENETHKNIQNVSSVYDYHSSYPFVNKNNEEDLTFLYENTKIKPKNEHGTKMEYVRIEESSPFTNKDNTKNANSSLPYKDWYYFLQNKSLDQDGQFSALNPVFTSGNHHFYNTKNTETYSLEDFYNATYYPIMELLSNGTLVNSLYKTLEGYNYEELFRVMRSLYNTHPKEL